MKPSLSLTGNMQYQDDGVNRLLNVDNQSYAVGFALHVPLFASPAPPRGGWWRKRK